MVMPLNRIYVVGSGFSSCAGTPVLRDVLLELFKNKEDPLTKELKNYLQNLLFPNQKDEWIHSSTLEEILSRLDLIKMYRPYENVDYHQVSHYEEMLLQKFSSLLSPGSTQWQKPSYQKFVKSLTPKDVIISFNYDLIMETLLKESGILYDYCLHWSEANGTLGKAVKLIKLHGSINQYYCPECGHILFEEAESKKTRPCPYCLKKGVHINTRQLMIAPTLFKSYSLPSLRALWFQTLQLLGKAEEIIFIGYSLPEADVLAYQLFDFGYKAAGEGQKATLVNGHHLSPERFANIYGKGLFNTGLYFEEWIAQRRLP